MPFTYLPITSERAIEFFASSHKADNAKGIVAHSPTLKAANDTFWRKGYPLQLRKRLLATYKQYVNNPSMTGVPFSNLNYKYDWKEELLHVEDKTLEEIINS